MRRAKRSEISTWLAKVIAMFSVNSLVTTVLLYVQGILNKAGFVIALVLINVILLLCLTILLVSLDAKN
jgi:hypothetical protein